MKVSEIVQMLGGSIISRNSDPSDRAVQYAFASDLMSDVLTLTVDDVLLITGLASVQTVRTAIIADISCVLLVRNKQITEDMRTLAEDNDIVLLQTDVSMFRASGLLYSAGLHAVY